MTDGATQQYEKDTPTNEFKIFYRDDGENPSFESVEEINEELEMMYLASDSEFIITKNDKIYCTGKLDKGTGYDIKKLNSAYLMGKVSK